MASREKSSLKRGRASIDADSSDLKKPRRSQRISSQQETLETPVDRDYLPTPLTDARSTATDIPNEVTATPPDSPSHHRQQSPTHVNFSQGLSSPPGDTQALSQFVYPPRAFADEVEDESGEGVWGYLIPLDDKVSAAFVLKKRDGCSGRDELSKDKANKRNLARKQGTIEHPEATCSVVTQNVKKKGDIVAVLEDLSSNGTFVNDAIVGRNKHRELEDGDEVSILNEARFVFRYPRTRDTNGFSQQYRILQQLGKGHFATVYLCVERATGKQFAVKVFEKRSGDSQKTQTDTLQQEIALLMGVNHPNLLCLRDIFDENDGAYLVLELAPEGELFNLIVSKQKLSEAETRHVFRQLFEGLKYLVRTFQVIKQWINFEADAPSQHDRGIVHRDIKPENILVADKKLTVKLGDFGLAKIIGEDSFTTTL
ncbi:serine/threonine-protein kinase chk2 (cds1) [Penicillium maclennaniae]|uniref:serine/threonine-protein kinase chk2 (cds1) n=1 Tax=Penicillium maclennaniae TaxID=1343394 RepID=UPI002540F8DA|nr:serine/threonine-protein kinase chk2 (cds1) [Penicillium maclennaniae]KAJ5674848.1 serine/threonine-protein kinase chk2 (cds1) [Penicillium maclennaniae]